MGVCGYLPARVRPFLSLTHFFFLLFFFLFSSVSVPAKPFLFTSILSDFRELFREDAAHRMRTPSSSALLDGMYSLKKLTPDAAAAAGVLHSS